MTLFMNVPLSTQKYLFGFALTLIIGSVLVWANYWKTPAEEYSKEYSEEHSGAQQTRAPPDSATEARGLIAAVTDEQAANEEIISVPDVVTETSAVSENIEEDQLDDKPTSALDERVAALGAQLLDERQARKRVEDELNTLKAQLTKLEQRLQQISPEQRLNWRREPRPLVSSKNFFEAGFDNVTADYLSERWSEQEMALLYLRDQATREGWVDTEQYQQAVRELRQDSAQLREELGEEDYARYLYALGMPNRVQVDSVISNSPAQAAGLLPGDRIIRYDGQRIYTRHDLRNVSTAGEPDLPVTVLIERDGALIETIMPRGPLGVMLSPLSELSAG